MSHVISVTARIRADRVDELLAAALRNAQAAVGTEPGCLQFDVLQDAQDPLALSLYEVYADEAAFAAHQETAHHRRYFAEAHDLLSSRAKTAYRRAFPSQPHKIRGATMGVSLVIDCAVEPGKREQLMAALEALATASRAQEPGCLQFDILEDLQQPDKLMLYEVYRDAAAVEAHQRTAHFQKFLLDGLPLYASHTLKRFDRLAP